MKTARAWLWLVIATAFYCLSVGGVQGEETRRDHREDVLLPVGEKVVRVEVYSPDDSAPPGAARACALVLHGAGGMFFDGPEMRRVARTLAARGVRAYVVHYFNVSGFAFAFNPRVLQAHFDEFRTVVECAVDFVRSRERQPAQPIGIYGYSMGGFVGLAVSANDPKIGALVEQAGGVWDGHFERLGRMPPVLMIHGRADERVPFERFAVPLEHALRTRSPVVQTLFFDGEGHVLRAAAQAHAREASAAFFARRLTGGKTVATPGKPVQDDRQNTIPRKR